MSSKQRLHFAHVAPADEHFVIPQDALAWLHKQAVDPAAQVLAVTGSTGFGKTGLVASFLRQRWGDLPRGRDGVFYWSLVEDPSVDNLVDALCSFAGLDVAAIPSEARFDSLTAVLGEQSLIVALDGLEVHQQASLRGLDHLDDLLADEPAHSTVGSVMDSRLLRLLEGACHGAWSSLIIVTSRYHLPDLHRWLWSSYWELDAVGLTLDEAEAAQLLRSCSGHPLSDEDCRKVWQQWDGYPLRLRMTAELIRHAGRIPLDHAGLDVVAATHHPGIAKLLEVYQSRLSARQRFLLGVISLFRIPASVPIIDSLVTYLPPIWEATTEDSQDDLLSEIQMLCDFGLVIRQSHSGATNDVYACHPALRAEIASSFERASCCAEPLPVVVDESDGTRGHKPRHPTRLMRAAISCLLEAGEYARADEVFRTRLRDGWLFFETCELDDGAMCILEFVRDEQRRRACKRLLSEGRLVHYLHMAGLFQLLIGDVQEAAKSHTALACQSDVREATRIMLNQSLICSLTGEVSRAEDLARHALQITQPGDADGRRHCLCCLAHTLSVQGRMRAANRLFHKSQQHSSTLPPRGRLDDLSYVDTVLWGWHLLRHGKPNQAWERMQAELHNTPETAENEITGGHAPFHQWLLAEADLALGHLERGLLHASDAESAFRSRQARLGLPLILLTKAKAYLGLGRLQDAWDASDVCWRLAAEHKLHMVHGAALVVRARIRLENVLQDRCSEPADEVNGNDYEYDDDEIEAAGSLTLGLDTVVKSADDALRLVPDCAEISRDAYLVKAEAAKANNDPEWEEYERQAAILTRRLRGDDVA